MESPGVFADSPLEQDDSAYPCKGCGEILEEGKAFELAGNRWHIDCFRCNTCGTLLDSDANLLLLGDGSLICNNCTYSCNSCGNKIEDLAILTGDQAFCAACFRCRNCKQKIDNLRYARTSQGIFCMTCHETLMARRRKKSRAALSAKANAASQSPMLLDKSLPSLPPSAVPENILSPDDETPLSDALTETPTELSPRPKNADARKDSSKVRKHERSPLHPDERKGLPSAPLPDKRQTYVGGAESDAFNIPLVLDTGAGLDQTISPQNAPLEQRQDEADRAVAGNRSNPTPERDYFAAKRPAARHQKYDKQPSSPSASAKDQDERDGSNESGGSAGAIGDRGPSASAEPTDAGHINERVRKQPQSRSTSKAPSPDSGGDDTRLQHARPPTPRRNGNLPSTLDEGFKLQEVPRNKKTTASPKLSRSETQSPVDNPTRGLARSLSGSVRTYPRQPNDLLASVPSTEQKTLLPAPAIDSPRSSSESRIREDLSANSTRSISPSTPNQMLNMPKRKDSLRVQPPRQTVPRKDAVGPAPRSSSTSPHTYDYPSSGSANNVPTVSSTTTSSAATPVSGSRKGSHLEESPSFSAVDAPVPQLRTHTRLGPSKLTTEESFTTPRAPPQPPQPPQSAQSAQSVQSAQSTHSTLPHPSSPHLSFSTMHTDGSRNGDGSSPPGLPQHNQGEEFSMEDDMARILGGNDEQSSQLLSRASNVVRHGRSFSDMETRTRAAGAKWPRSPMNGQINAGLNSDVAAPLSPTPEAREANAELKSELRRSAQKIAELETRVSSTGDIKAIETKLREKRSTVAFLDSQRELMVRELEVLTENVGFAKNTRRPLDVESMTSKMLNQFAMSLERLKETYGAELKDLIGQRNQLLDETSRLQQAREQAIEETEQLNLKNAQLADLNNELTHQIQERYKANRDQAAGFESPKPTTNGLGIYPPPARGDREKPGLMVEDRDTRPGTGYAASNSSSMQGLVADQDTAEAVLAAPHVVNIRKGQVKKFNWKKGGQSVAKGVSKGFKGAFSTNPQHQYLRDGQGVEGMPYGAMPTDSPISSISAPRPNVERDASRQGLGFFGQRKGMGMPTKMPSNGNMAGLVAEAPATLFGSELVDRADYERRQIPSVVTRCIEEVELRGMDIEGIYRKTGGNSQVKTIQEGFERSDDYDISDAGLDITAVTSVLKQYFRRLPTPLLTFDVYDSILESNSMADDEKRALAIRTALQRLPLKHRDCLEFLVFHLARVATREKENLMTPKNLAVVFAPTIMRDNSLEREMTDMHAKNTAIQFLIENNKFIFSGP